MKYYIDPFKKVFDFNGKSTKKEFWMFFLWQIVAMTVFGVIQGLTGIEYIGKAYLIASLLPFMSLGFRRLNEGGFNKLLFLIPFVNIILASVDRNKLQ
jgi:uncharacterized membrane protein YhaH (DUF805 family)